MTWQRLRSLLITHNRHIINGHSKLSTSNQYLNKAEDVVIFEVHNKVGCITLNRPKVLNSINSAIVRSMYPVLLNWEKDPNVQLIMIKGKDGVFSAGGDIRPTDQRSWILKLFAKEEYTMFNQIGILKTPYVALIDGLTFGGGCGLSVNGRYRVATERTIFAMPETAIGLYPDCGGSYFLSRLEGKLGLFLGLTGQRLKGKDVYFSGIATHYVESQDMNEMQSELINERNLTLDRIEQILNEYHAKYEGGEFSMTPYMEQINKCFSGESMEDIMRLLKEDGSEWALKYLHICEKMSPTSMKVTYRAYNEASQMRCLTDVIQMEYRLTCGIIDGVDVYEGVDAKLVRRDDDPKWKPAILEEVTEEMVDEYFRPLGNNGDIDLPKE